MQNKKLNISKEIMSQIKKGQIKMKPRWYFIMGSVLMFVGFIGLTLISIFLISLISFSFRTHGPMGDIRYQQMTSSFPWWAPVITVISLGVGITMLRKYEFSYKKNFLFIVFCFVAAVMLAGWSIDFFNIELLWMRQGPMKRLYQQYNGGSGMKGSNGKINKNNRLNLYKGL